MAIGINGKAGSVKNTETSSAQPQATTKSKASPVDTKPKTNAEHESEEDVGLDSDTNAKKLGVIAAIAVVVIVIGFLVIPNFTSKTPDPVVPDAETTTPDPVDNTDPVDDTTDDTTNTTTDDRNFVTGDPDYKAETNQTTDHLDSADSFVLNLQGESVPVNYTVKTREYVKTHVNYVARRAVIDEGMEMYWLDITYKRKKYRAQVPYYYFKDLEEEGICRMELEVLNLENGGQIISYMQIIGEDD